LEGKYAIIPAMQPEHGPPMIHALSDVQTKNIGPGTRVWQYAVILKNAVIGSNCNINCHTFIENDVIVGDNVTIKSGVYLWDGLRIAGDVFVGPNVTFINDRYPRSKQYPETFPQTVIGKGASLGAAATILCGLTIGEYAMIGAGSLLTKSVRPHTLWYGNPAKHQGYVTRKGVPLTLELRDKKTGKAYSLRDGIEPVET
jgi:acetyltransferase-like isoleucine patch superfamily enzyme